MTKIPFDLSGELYTKLSSNPKYPHLIYPSRPDKDTLPGNPRILLQDPNIGLSLRQDLTTPDLNILAPHLWLVAKQDGEHISPLTHQLVRGRQIIITEKPELHLVWVNDRVYIKPLPIYLLSHAFWQYYLVSNNSPIPDPLRCHIAQAALGLLRSYARLIQHKSDFRLAQDTTHQLLPKNIRYSQFI
ncbi:MAG: hypothetical protein MMC33_007987 [Icmadophila ericetorum]|nr:hypothetical protein [Icmadophila ericetorum]